MITINLENFLLNADGTRDSRYPLGDKIPTPSPTGAISLDDFNYASVPIVRVDGDSKEWPLWYQDGDNEDRLPGTVTVENGGPFGNYLQNIIQGGPSSKPMHLNFYNNHGGVNNDWWFMREHIGAAYDALKKYNRLRFWIKVPVGIYEYPVSQTNIHVGTYLRTTGGSSINNESNNWHFYHYFNITDTENWQQVIVDPHPSHQRSANGTTEHGVKDETNLQTGYDYFDLMTYFYLQSQWGTGTAQTYQYDRFELYEETYDEDIENIYSLTGVRNQKAGEENEIIVSWKRDKAKDSESMDVRYSFTSFYENGGWTHGQPAPSGTGITPTDSGGWNGMRYATSAIDLTGQDVIYIAIKHEDEATRFRQIAIPLTAAGYTIVGGA